MVESSYTQRQPHQETRYPQLAYSFLGVNFRRIDGIKLVALALTWLCRCGVMLVALAVATLNYFSFQPNSPRLRNCLLAILFNIVMQNLIKYLEAAKML